MDYKILKYPRTPHLQGSRLQAGDEDLSRVPFSRVLNTTIVIEEKIDGANCAISFDNSGTLLLQSRGHYLVGGSKERNFDLFKVWANSHRDSLWRVLGDRFVMYGEWMRGKHAIFYDELPDYFMEFDVYDRKEGEFLSTDRRRKITDELGFVHSVPVLGCGVFKRKEQILEHLKNSNYISENYIENLKAAANGTGLDEAEVLAQSDLTRTMEGLYIKEEIDGRVNFRVKFVRNSFRQQLVEPETNWHARPIIANMLKIGKD